MDQTIQLDKNFLRGKFVLPDDVTFLPVTEIDEKTRGQLGEYRENDVAISRTRARVTSKIINRDFANLIEEFKEPNSLPFAIAKFYEKNPENENPEAILDEALPMFVDLVKQTILVPEKHKEDEIEYRLTYGDKLSNDLSITRKIQLFSDTEVYQAIDANNQCYAIKLLRPNTPNVLKQKLVNEKKLLEKASSISNHSQVIEGEYDNCIWIASQWINGSPIVKVSNELILENQWSEVKTLLTNLADTFAKLHDHKIIHGDVHVNNILVTAENKPCIIDYGNAYHIDEIPKDYHRAGVAFFYEPEFSQALLRNEAPPTANYLSEQFSIAALIFHLLTGNYYDDFELEEKAMHTAIANAQPKSLVKQGGPNWPDLEKCLNKALSIKPSDRYQSMHEFKDAINACKLPDNLFNTNNISGANDVNLNNLKGSLNFLSTENELYSKGMKHGPLCSLNGGKIGIAYALLKLACSEEDPKLFNQAKLWLAKARNINSNPEFSQIAYTDSNHAEEFEQVETCSTHHGYAGIPFLETLAALAGNDLIGVENSLSEFLSTIHSPSKSNDTTIGKLSGILSLCEIFEYFSASVTEEVQSNIHKSAHQIITNIWQELDAVEHINDCQEWHNLGFAHGWAGLLYTSLLWHKKTGSDLPKVFMKRVDQLVSCLYPEGRGRFIYWKNETTDDKVVMSGWCNGSAGLIYLFCLLYQHDHNPKWRGIAEQLGWHTWEQHNGSFDLCCGAAGRAFSLIHLSEVTGNQHWHSKAKRLIEWTWEASEAVENDEREPYHLFKGHLGLILAAKALEKPSLITMPMMGMA